MINIICFHIFQAARDLAFLAIFAACVLFYSEPIFLAKIIATAIFTAIFSTLGTKYFKKDFHYLGYFFLFKGCYTTAFSACVAGLVLNIFRQEPSLYVYYLSLVLFIIGLVGKITLCKNNLH